MIATTQRGYPCQRCSAVRSQHAPGLCWECELERRAAQPVGLIVCQNCELEAPNRGRGLCPRCYQFLWRTGTLPPPNRTTPEEVLGE